MPAIKYIESDGTRHDVIVSSGLSIMQGAVSEGVPGIDATCGGACACATCHVYIDEQWVGALTPPSEAESEMLEFVVDPAPNSRLSCQIEVTNSLDGLIVRLPVSQA